MEPLPTETARARLIGRALRRRWVTVVAFTVGATVAAGAVAWVWPTSYTSTVEVMLTPVIGNTLAPDSARSGDQINVAMQTEAGLIGSPPVADLVSGFVDAPVEPSDSRVTATVLANTQIIEISYTADTADDAVLFADAYARALLKSRSDKAADEIDSQLAVMEQQQSAALAGLKQASADASAEGSLEANGMVQLYTNRLAALQEAVGTLDATPTEPGSVISPASRPTSSDGVPAPLLIAVGLLVGLLAGVLFAVSREWGDDRIRADVGGYVGDLPIVGVMDATASGVDDRSDEAFRLVRASLLASMPPPSTVAFAGVDESFDPLARRVADGVGEALAMAGYATEVVDVTSARGGAEMRARLAEAGRVHDYVVIASPAMSMAEGNEMAMAAECTILIAGDGTTTGAQIHQTAARADQFGVRVLGVVAVRTRRRSRRRATHDAEEQDVDQPDPLLEASLDEASTDANGGTDDEHAAESSDSRTPGR